MKKAIVYLMFIWCDFANYAQEINMDSIFEPKLSGEIFHLKTGTLGKQFYNDNWEPGDIKLNSGEKVVNKQLMYNGLMDEVIWLQSDSLRMVKLEKHFIEEFCFKNHNGKAVRFKKIQTKLPALADSSDIFVEILTERNASLLVYRNVIIEDKINRMQAGVLYSFDKLMPQPVYILVLPDQQTIQFKRINRRVLLKLLPQKYRDVFKALIQRNHLSVHTEDELAKLVSLVEK